MSAIKIVCPECGQTYIAGVVGSTPWPAHVCLVTRPAHDLAADVRAIIGYDDPGYPTEAEYKAARAALDALVAQVDTLTREKEWWTAVNAELLPYQERALAAEAALAHFRECADTLNQRLADMRRALAEIERAALKAAQLLPMTVSTSVEADHRNDHSSWAGWLLRHKVLPVARRALAGNTEGTA